jgi:hypothetical protein
VAYPAVLLLRRVFPGLDNFGPVFWASDVVPPGFDQATAEQGVLTVNQTDATTQADVATLSDPSSPLPCPPPSTGNLKCEAVRVRDAVWVLSVSECLHSTVSAPTVRKDWRPLCFVGC